MASLFDRIAAAAAATHDRVIGDLFDYIPMARPTDKNAREVPDTSRAVATGLRLPFGNPTARAFSGPVRTVGVKAGMAEHATDRPFVSLQLSLLPYAPKELDRLRNVDTGELFQVAEILPSTPGFVRLDLTRV